MFPTASIYMLPCAAVCSIEDFEFTQECATFDVSGIRLVHGWLVDPGDRLTVGTPRTHAPHAIQFPCLNSGQAVAKQTCTRGGLNAHRFLPPPFSRRRLPSVLTPTTSCWIGWWR